MPSSGQRRKGPGPLAASASYTGEAHAQQTSDDQRKGSGADISAQLRANSVCSRSPCEPDYGPHPTPDRRL